MNFKFITKKKLLERLLKNDNYIAKKVTPIDKKELGTTKETKEYIQQLTDQLNSISPIKPLFSEGDFKNLSNFITKDILFSIDKIIDILKKNKNISKKEIFKKFEKEKQQGNTIKSDLRIMNLFYRIFDVNKTSIILENLTKFRNTIASNDTIYLIIISQKDFSIFGGNEAFQACAVPYNKRFENVIWFGDEGIINTYQFDCSYFINESLYLTILHELTHLIFYTKDDMYHSNTLDCNYFFDSIDYTNQIDLSNNADTYAYFIMTAALYLEKDYPKQVNLKSKEYNYIIYSIKEKLKENEQQNLVRNHMNLINTKDTIDDLEEKYKVS